MTGLPVETLVPELRRTLSAEGTSALVTAMPGSGKTTILPLRLLAEPWLENQKIILLEPRRLAAKMAAWRMSELLGEKTGQTVGYRVRQDVCVSSQTRLEIVTEGILTRMLQHDPGLSNVGLVIFDEFHERSLQADLALALTLDARSVLRPDLRILVMSATLDAKRLSTLLEDASVLSCGGQLFPVETIYAGRPPARRADAENFTLNVILRAWRENENDILVFLPGMAEILRLKTLLSETPLPETVIHVLHGSVSKSEQEAAVRKAPEGLRKIVLSTSIAESSMTLEGVRAVVDSTLERTAVFHPGTGMDRLVTRQANTASLDQRRGRAGRLAPGRCYRLLSEADMRSLKTYAEPEILRTDLAPFQLELACWGTASASELRLLDQPPEAAVRYAKSLLNALDALDESGHATPRGRKMNDAAVHPRLAHMILGAETPDEKAIACELAALIEEGDFIRDEREMSVSDVHLRLGALHGAAAPNTDRFRMDTVRRTAAGLKQTFKTGEGHPDKVSAGRVLARAFPDRIAQRRGNGVFLMVNGRGVSFPFPDALRNEPYLVIADYDDRDDNGRIRLACALNENDIRHVCASHLEEKTVCRYDENKRRAEALREERLGALVLRSDTSLKAKPEEALPLLMEAVQKEGLSALPWTDALQNWRDRISFLHGVQEFADDYPDFSDEALSAELELWLPEALCGKTSLDSIRESDLFRALESLVDYKALSRLNQLAPATLEVPSGSKIKLRYDPNLGPVLAVRLQELFGLFSSPCIADHKVTVTLEMLSPAMRPVQTTRDLANFWREGYFYVRKELRGRYPKHYWPEDPLDAEAIPGSRRKKPQ